MTTTAFTDIGWLTTHDPAHALPDGVDPASSGVGRHGDEVGRGLTDAWVVVDSGRVAVVGTGSTGSSAQTHLPPSTTSTPQRSANVPTIARPRPETAVGS